MTRAGSVAVDWCVEQRKTMAVVTRTGHLVHLWNPAAKVGCLTYCGREVVGFNTPNVDEAAATCSPCKTRRSADA